MTRKLITGEELARKVLAAVRQHDGCESVKEVAITQVDIIDQKPTWNVNVVDEGEAKREVVITALTQVHDQLLARYELTDSDRRA